MIGKLLLAAALVGGVGLALAPAAKPVAEPLHLSVSPAEARARLDVGQRLVKGTGLGFLTVAPVGRDGDTLLIGVTRANSPARVGCRVTVTSPADASGSAGAPAMGSDALVDCAQPPSKEPAVQQVGIKAIEIVVGEHVIATTMQRPYDIDRVSKAMLTLILLNRPVLAASAMRED